MEVYLKFTNEGLRYIDNEQGDEEKIVPFDDVIKLSDFEEENNSPPEVPENIG